MDPLREGIVLAYEACLLWATVIQHGHPYGAAISSQILRGAIERVEDGISAAEESLHAANLAPFPAKFQPISHNSSANGVDTDVTVVAEND